MSLRTPVALCIFNRPAHTAKVFAMIRRAQPRQLYVIGDGPRFETDRELVEAARRVIATGIDWECEVRTAYAETNLGCKRRIASGLDWLFEQCEQAIILEDDCVPHEDFFPFTETLLDRYKDEAQVLMVSGQSFSTPLPGREDSYFFSRNTLIWGWGTWKRAWKHYDVEMAAWPKLRESEWLSQIVPEPRRAATWHQTFDRVYSGGLDTWDHQWRFAFWLHGGLAAVPYANLVSNIGFGEGATHVKRLNGLANMEVEDIEFPLRHPDRLEWNAEEDERVQQRIKVLTRSNGKRWRIGWSR